MTTYESGNAKRPSRRHLARGARARAAARLRDHGSPAGPQRRPRRPAHRHGVSGPAPPGAGRPGPGELVSRRRRLLDATDAHRSAGLPPAQAAQAAICEFGDPGQAADGFRAEIAASQARRVAIALLATGPLVGLLWIATAAASHLAIPLAVPWHWTGQPAGLLAGIDLVAVAAGVTAWAALVGIATTGRLTRWLPIRPRRAPMTAAVAGFGAVSADGLGLALLAAQLATAPGKLSPALAAAAAAASLARLVLARRAARQCLAIRASLT